MTARFSFVAGKARGHRPRLQMRRIARINGVIRSLADNILEHMLTAGSRIGPYEIKSSLGEGGMGVVFRALDIKLQRDVALKLLPDHFAADAERLARFQREAQVLASLN